MRVEICKWYQDKLSPVVFMVDDFCNVWVDTNSNGIIDLGEDWGYARRGSGSSLVFLEETILKDFPEVKVTFFVPVGIRSSVIEHPDIPFISKRINCNADTKMFFKSVGDNPRYEVAYHGTTHGKPGRDAKDFIQEWDSFESLEQAKQTITEGKKIFKEVMGVYPSGGKYCGYVANSFSDQSIDQSGFSWWCRDEGANFDIQYFGENNVVDIPTTLPGLLYNSIVYPGPYNLKGILKRLLKPLLIKWKTKRIKLLLNNHAVISIQEHIAPSRTDGKRQMPNIFDDLLSLKMILEYLKQYPTWYCTCSELARYVTAREATKLEVCSGNSFNILTNSPKVEGEILTLKFYSVHYDRLIQPDGTEVSISNQLANIKVMNGIYTLS